MDAKHTPGPWRVEQEPEWPFHIYIINSDGEVVGCERRHAYSTSHKSIDDVMQAKGFRNNREECIEANARQLANETLKAAAPELLHALKALLAETTGPEEVWAEGSAVEHARAAIAKATGE